MDHLKTMLEIKHNGFMARLYEVKSWFSDEGLRIMVYWDSPVGEIEIFNTAYGADQRKVLFHPKCDESQFNYTKSGSCSPQYLQLVFNAIHISEQRSKNGARNATVKGKISWVMDHLE